MKAGDLCLCGQRACLRCFPPQATHSNLDRAEEIVGVLRFNEELRDEVFSNFCRDCRRYLRPDAEGMFGPERERCYCERDD